jgi:hypothetical protein
VLCRPIYPRAIVLLLPLDIIPDREVKHDWSFARVYAVHHFVASCCALAYPCFWALFTSLTRLLGSSFVLTSCRHTRPATRALGKSTSISYLTMQNGASKVSGDGSVENRPPSTEADSDEANQFHSEDEDHGDHETLCRSGKRKRPVSVS